MAPRALLMSPWSHSLETTALGSGICGQGHLMLVEGLYLVLPSFLSPAAALNLGLAFHWWLGCSAWVLVSVSLPSAASSFPCHT